MKLIYALLLCLVVSTCHAATEAPDDFIICAEYNDVDELLIAIKANDKRQMKYIFDSLRCFFIKPGLPISYAGNVNDDVFKIRTYGRKGSAIWYSHTSFLAIINGKGK